MNRYLRRFDTYEEYEEYIGNDGGGGGEPKKGSGAKSGSSEEPVYPNVCIVKSDNPYSVYFNPLQSNAAR